MSHHHDELYIHHIQETSRKIIQRAGVTRAAFDADEEKQNGLFVRWRLLAKPQAKCLRPFAKVIPASIGVA